MIALIVQARMGSARLPGKILKPLCGKPMLLQQLIRLRSVCRANAFVLATTALKEDDPVTILGAEAGYSVFRGSEEDVLDRYYEAAEKVNADIVVRVTGDCPLHDSSVVDKVVEHYLDGAYDYTKQPDNYPEGLDTEVFTFEALKRARRGARLHSEREHVTPFIRNHPESFIVDKPWFDGASDHRDYHWSVDTEADFRFVEQVYAELYEENTMFTTDHVLALMDRRPELLLINSGGTGFEGLEKSLKEDKERNANST